MQTSKIKFIVLDFDGTAAHFGVEGSRGWFPIFIRRGISKSLLEESYRLVREQGFSIENILNQLQKNTEHKFNKQEIHQEFEQWFVDSLVLYPDTLAAIKQWQKAGIPVFVLSAGESEYQMQKIRASKILYDKVIVTSQPFKKAEVFAKLVKTYGKPAVFIDNQSDILDKVCQKLKSQRIITVWIQRAGSEYAGGEAKFSHIKADSLNAPQIQKVILGK